MRTRVLTLLAAATAAVAAPTAASAATIVGTLAASLSGIQSSTSSIGANSTFTNRKSTVDDVKGDFGLSLLDEKINISSITATAGSSVSFTSAFGDFLGTVSSVTPTIQGQSRVVSLYVLGNLTPSGSLSSFSKGAASITFSFNQTGGAGSVVSGSYTLASPPSPVAEPATWGMMIAGAGMAGAAVRRRRSTKVAAA